MTNTANAKKTTATTNTQDNQTMTTKEMTTTTAANEQDAPIKSIQTKTIFVRRGDRIDLGSINPGHREIYSLAPGYYAIEFDRVANMFFLRAMEMQEMPKKIFGDVSKRSERILNTFKDRGINTGVLLHGMKGTGKSLLSRQVCVDAVKAGMPVLILQEAYAGPLFNSFLEQIVQPCVVNVDEFEKTYSNRDDTSAQEGLLSLLDGVSQQNKLWLLTVNETKRVNNFMMNRPGRIFYKFEYGVIPEEVIVEVCEYNGLSREKIDNLLSIYTFINELTFDVLKAIIEESKRYDEMPSEAIKYLNIDVGVTSYLYSPRVQIFADDKLVLETTPNSFNSDDPDLDLGTHVLKEREMIRKLMVYREDFKEELISHKEQNEDDEKYEPSEYDFSTYALDLVKIEGRKGVREYKFKDLMETAANYGDLAGTPTPKFRVVVIPNKPKKFNHWNYAV